MVPGAFGGEFRDKEKMSGDGKLARFFAKKWQAMYMNFRFSSEIELKNR